MLAALGLALGGLGLYGVGLSGVPFHPDESTYLFMSRDFDRLGEAGALAWMPGQPLTAEARYRLLDGPLPRYLIGLGRWLAGYPASELNPDWAWDQSWEVNQRQGSLPATGLLLAGRAFPAALGALTPALLFLLGREARGSWTGLLAALLLGLHPQMLLHTRRAMAEGPMLFFSALAALAGLALARRVERQFGPDPDSLSPPATLQERAGNRRGAPISVGISAPVAFGLALGLAAAAKHSALAPGLAVLLPASLAAVQRIPETWSARVTKSPTRPRSRSSLPPLQALGILWLTAGLSAALIFFLLNPVMHRAPLAAAREMLAQRLLLVRGQTDTLRAHFPEQVLPTALSRLRAAAGQLFVRPPAVWDVAIAGQMDYLRPQAEAFLSSGLSALPPAGLGAALAGLGAAGLAASGLRLKRNGLGAATRAEQVLWVWGAGALGFILLAVTIDWQRYFLPLLPPVCLFTAMGAETLAAPLTRSMRRRSSAPRQVPHEPTV